MATSSITRGWFSGFLDELAWLASIITFGVRPWEAISPQAAATFSAS
jgi:hypothetical protein